MQPSAQYSTHLAHLAADETGVEAAGNGGIGGAFDDGAAVGEEGHLVGGVPEFQDEVIVADRAVGLKAEAHLCEVDRALALMDLHGIPAAQRDVRTSLPGKMNEISFAASATPKAWLGSGYFGMLVGPDIERKQTAPQR